MAMQVVDMRRGMDGLAAMVQQVYWTVPFRWNGLFLP